MSNYRSEHDTRELHRKILTSATALFIQKGYEKTTIIDIAKHSGVPKSKILYVMKSKEDILGYLVTRFLDGVTAASDAAAKELTDNQVFVFLANEVLQLYMAELSEDMRNLYLSGYSLPLTSQAVLLRRTQMMYDAFGDVFAGFEKKDFYQTEIASMGIMRAYMSVPCDAEFTISDKAEKLVVMLLRIYRSENQLIKDALSFIEKIDFETVAKRAIGNVFRELNITPLNDFR